MAKNSKKPNTRKTTKQATPPKNGPIPSFTEEQATSLISIATKAGLPFGKVDEFKIWLSDISCVAAGAQGHKNILTARQQKKLFRDVLRPLCKALHALENNDHTNYLRSYHHRYCQKELKQEGKPLTNEQVNAIGPSFDVELRQLKRWQAVLEFSIAAADEDPPNSDEQAKANPAFQATENAVLEFILKYWRCRFQCRVSMGQTAPLVRFCVEVFEAFGWLPESDDPHDAMRKRMKRIDSQQAKRES